MRALKSLFFFIFLYVFLFCRAPVHAVDAFQKDYEVDYYLAETDTGIQARAVFNLKLTNLSGEIIIKTFALAFPKTFTVDNIKASNNGDAAAPRVGEGEEDIQIQLDVPNAAVGRGTVNNIRIEFNQNNLFKVSGNVWEVILPTLDLSERNSYRVSVHLPDSTDKKISISKPRPDSIQGNVVTWVNPQLKTIYAVFGDKQLYQTKLVYHLSNPKFTPVYTDIALVPDTAYQKTYIKSLVPAPTYVYLDEDSNYMARYILKPRENLDVIYDGTIESFVKPRDETRPYIKKQFEKQKSYLTDTPGFWENNSDKTFASVEEVYKHVTSTFSYNYERINQNVSRLGAQTALTNPANAVCTEFTDSFVALARNNRFYTREVQGYGFANDPRLRPISQESDILHAWPEYYDAAQHLWIPIDPTWENTSGIDYFRSFDLNHITFVMHGRRPDSPYPAGTYKQKDSKDIDIKTTSTAPTEQLRFETLPYVGPKRIYPGQNYTGEIIIRNNGNIYAWDVPIAITSSGMKTKLSDSNIAVLAPYEQRKITLTYSAAGQTSGKSNINVMVDGKTMRSIEIDVTPIVLDVMMVALPVVGVLIFVIIFIIKRRAGSKV